MSLTNHPIWNEIAPHIKIEIYAPDGGHSNPRFRLEFKKSVTQEQKKKWVAITMPCVKCGATIHPIRERKQGGRAPDIGHIYIAPCCSLQMNVGCSRGVDAHAEYLKIRSAVEALTTNPNN